MRAMLRILLIGAAALSLTACMGSKNYAGPGRYLVKGPGHRIVGGPYADTGACHHATPQKQHGRTYVCIYLPEDVRPNIWKKAS